MSNDSWFRKRFRSNEAQRNHDASAALDQLRAEYPPEKYSIIFNAFRAAAPKTYRALSGLGVQSPSDLVWTRRPLRPLTLEREFWWANEWLSNRAGQVNLFRHTALEIQTRVMTGDLEDATRLLDIYVRSSGWSLWAVELRAALIQLASGTTAQREWLSSIQARAINSVPGLLFEVFGDRNDDTYSYDAIYGKCMTSFPRFEQTAFWLPDYLKYRALAHIDDPAKSLPNILSRDITSSLIDYYEDVIDALSLVAGKDSLEDCRSVATELIKSLIARGYKDHRLDKLLVVLGSTRLSVEEIHSQPEKAYRAIYIGSFHPEGADLPVGIVSDLLQCQSEGTAMYDSVGKSLKWGLNLRGLDVGPAVAMAALRSISSQPSENMFLSGAFLLSSNVCLDDLPALSKRDGFVALKAYLISNDKYVSEEDILKPSSWNVGELIPEGGPVYLWLAGCLLDAGNFDELEKLIEFLRGKSSFWTRQCAKFSILANVRLGSIEKALAEMERWSRKNHLYILEFPAATIFHNRKWSEFRDLDPILVGIVAHHEYTTRGNANVAYICKMACRAFLQRGLRDQVIKEFATLTVDRKEQIISFLRDVWIEENLTMCHQWTTTAEVRSERMVVLQFLLSSDSGRALDYAEAIKDLTFEQTLQRGLQRIDQTRVFVNESAITRWAEKEIEQDYERWRRLSESSSGGRTVDNMLRQYVLNPENVEVLNEFANGKPTAADAILIDLIDRLYKRFLFDPTDGLNTYLSVRIRHGSFRGTILGPLEENGLIFSKFESSERAFKERWVAANHLTLSDSARILGLMQDFSQEVRHQVDEFVDQRVQIQSDEKPNGAILQAVSPWFAKLIASSLAERPPSFYAFLGIAYFAFWKIVETGLDKLRAEVNDVVAVALHNCVEELTQELRALGVWCAPLMSALTTASTVAKFQCGTVAEWFQLPSLVGGEKYQLQDAIEIASVATQNVHRGFPTGIDIACLPVVPLPLTTSALAVLVDCLFIVFENAWRHSGLSGSLPLIQVSAEFDRENKLLTLICRNALSTKRKQALSDGELSILCTKYLGDLPVELISSEGGSGFPKLARLTHAVDRNHCSKPFDFGIETDNWYTKLTIPVYEREGAYEAYE